MYTHSLKFQLKQALIRQIELRPPSRISVPLLRSPVSPSILFQVTFAPSKTPFHFYFISLWNLSTPICLSFTTCSPSLVSKRFIVLSHLYSNSKPPLPPHPSPIPTMAPHLGECRGTDDDRKPDSAASGEAGGQEAENRRRLWRRRSAWGLWEVMGRWGVISKPIYPRQTDRGWLISRKETHGTLALDRTWPLWGSECSVFAPSLQRAHYCPLVVGEQKTPALQQLQRERTRKKLKGMGINWLVWQTHVWLTFPPLIKSSTFP